MSDKPTCPSETELARQAATGDPGAYAAHLESCAPCQALWSQLELQALGRALPSEPTQAQAERARVRLMQAVTAETATTPPRRWAGRLAWGVPLAAALLLSLLRWGPWQPSPSEPSLAAPPAPPSPAAPRQRAALAQAPGALKSSPLGALAPPPLLAATPRALPIRPPLLSASETPTAAPHLAAVATQLSAAGGPPAPVASPKAARKPVKRRSRPRPSSSRARAQASSATASRTQRTRAATSRVEPSARPAAARATPAIPRHVAAPATDTTAVPQRAAQLPGAPVPSPRDARLNKAAATLSAGLRALRRGELSKARAAFASLQDKLPTHPIGRAAAYWAVQTELRAGHPRRAYAGMRRYLRLYPKSEHTGELSLLLAEAALREGRRAEAKALLRRAAEDPDPRIRDAAAAQLQSAR